jgi:hypothetical protein
MGEGRIRIAAEVAWDAIDDACLRGLAHARHADTAKELAMTTIDVTPTHLEVRLSGWDQVWALKRGLSIPLENVVGAEANPELGGYAGFRMPGTHWPGAITAGTYRKDSKWWFWNVRKRKRVVLISMRNERYSHLVLEVDNPEATAAMINNAIAAKAA